MYNKWFTAASGRYVRFSRVTSGRIRICDAAVYDLGGKRILAVAGTMNAVSGNNTWDKVQDGDPTTFCYSGLTSTTEFLQLDLGTMYTLSCMVIDVTQATPADFGNVTITLLDEAQIITWAGCTSTALTNNSYTFHTLI